MRRIRNGADIVIRQDDPGRSLDMRRKDRIGARGADGGGDLFGRGRGKGRVHRIARAPRLVHRHLARELTRVKDLRPAVGKPPVAHDKGMGPRRHLPRDRFHAKGPAPRDDGDVIGIIDLAQQGRDVRITP